MMPLEEKVPIRTAALRHPLPCLKKRCQPAGGDADAARPSRRCGVGELDVHDREGDTLLETLDMGEPHQAWSAAIADWLPVSVISTPSVSAGVWPVFRLVFLSSRLPAFGASATSIVAPRGVLAFDATVIGVSEIVRCRHLLAGNRQPISSADERRTEPLFLNARGECRARIECTRPK